MIGHHAFQPGHISDWKLCFWCAMPEDDSKHFVLTSPTMAATPTIGAKAARARPATRNSQPRTPITELERGLIEKLSMARFPPATASKSFVRDLTDGHVKELSDRGRGFLAYVAFRFRRQWVPAADERAWVAFWLGSWHADRLLRGMKPGVTFQKNLTEFAGQK